MIRKDLVPQLTEIQKKTLTKVNIARALMLIMKNHIGEENSISRNELYKTLFKEDDDMSLKSDLRWMYVSKAFNYLRKYTKCFCSSGHSGSSYYYFVLKDGYDQQTYSDILERNIKAMRTMQRKSLKAIENQWYKLEWHLPGEEPPELPKGKTIKEILFGKK